MTKPKPPARINPSTPHDPYKMRTLEQILHLFDGGEFLEKTMEGHRQLQVDLLEHKAEHGTKGCNGKMTITISYALGKSGDVSMGARVDFKSPDKPPASAAAFINDDGELTLYSPFMARMHEPVRDATGAFYDPQTGEVRDID
jgi:hypothetical protein